MSDLTALQKTANEASAALVEAVTADCPGPHAPKQHRDKKPAWCHICGRTRMGDLVGTPAAEVIKPEDYTREVLIGLCERGLKQATVDHWHDRDSAGACQQLGKAYALLCAGAEFVVLDGTNHPHHSESHLKTDDKTIWIHFDFPGFNAFEMGRSEREYWDDESAYIPTAARLDDGGDWY